MNQEGEILIKLMERMEVNVMNGAIRRIRKRKIHTPWTKRGISFWLYDEEAVELVADFNVEERV